MISPVDHRSVSELLADAFAQLARLFRNEVDLARVELSQKASQAAGAAKFIAAGAVILIPAIVLILFAIGAELIELGLSAPLAYLIAGVGGAIVSGALIWLGLRRLSGDALKPSVTIDEIRRDATAAREMVR
jgi:uncharacterized membrane protein